MRTLTVPRIPGVVNGRGDRCGSALANRRPGWSGSTVGPITTVLLAAIALVAVMFLVVVAAIALAARAYSRRQLGYAREWVPAVRLRRRDPRPAAPVVPFARPGLACRSDDERSEDEKV